MVAATAGRCGFEPVALVVEGVGRELDVRALALDPAMNLNPPWSDAGQVTGTPWACARASVALISLCWRRRVLMVTGSVPGSRSRSVSSVAGVRAGCGPTSR